MSIQIFLDDYNNVCFPGQTLSGRIECTFNSEKNLRAIKIKFRGQSKTSWTESESHYNSVTKKTETRSVHYYAEENYINVEYNLVQGGNNFSLSAGKHVYPFSYILPTQLPSSFEGSVGHIRYYVKAVVDRPWKFDYEARVPLNVASFIDLNLIPGLRVPVAISDEKTMCSCWCNDSGALTFNITVPVSGYVPGQEINIGCYVQNLTNVSAESVKFKVVARYEYITRYPHKHTKHYSYDIVKLVESGIGAHGEKSWTSTLVIPTNRVYPNLIPCSIMNVRYNLKAKVVVPSPHSNLELDFPITIGSVAISGVDTTIPGPPLPDVHSTFPNHDSSLINTNLPGYPLPDNSNPSYSEKYADGVPPPYFFGEEGGSGAPEATAPPLGIVPSYLPSAGGSTPYPPPTGGSAPYPPAIGLAPYIPPAEGSAPYPSSASGSSLYPPEKAGWSELNSKDTAASAPPSYEESQPQEKK